MVMIYLLLSLSGQEDDLNKLKMRVNGKSEIAFVESLGGVPVSLSTEELMKGFKKALLILLFIRQ